MDKKKRPFMQQSLSYSPYIILIDIIASLGC